MWEQIKNVFENAISTISASIQITFNAIKDFFTNIWDGICNYFRDMWKIIINVVKDSINKVKTAISFALDKIKAIWEKVWNTLDEKTKSIFSGIWNFIKNTINSILSGIEGMVNGVIKGINKMVDALNSLKFEIPDWVPGLGGKSFSLNLPRVNEITLPRLAEGGYVKANTPQLVMIGDNKNQGEVVAPESKMQEMVVNALKAFKQQEEKSSSPVGNEITINFEGSLSQLIRLLKIELDKESKRRGNKLIIGGQT